jgi:uncharacterized damage-inducible protein DinB
MLMLPHYHRLFDYDDWANREILTALQKLDTPPVRCIKLLAHILSAERLWLERMRSQKQTYPVWPDFSLEQCKLEIGELPGLWHQYLASLNEDSVSGAVTYQNTKGESFASRKEDMVMHVILHSAYHRGQIAMEMRAGGFTPAYTDFIHAVRHGSVK